MGNLSTRANDWLCPKKDAFVLMTGPDGSGKTTLLYKLKLDEVVETVPTMHCANVETLEYRNARFTIADIGGFDMWRFRPLIRHHFRRASAFVFVVDSSDHDRSLIDDVREEC